MIVSVFRRRLREGKSFEDFERAWEAEQGFGVGARVFNALSLSDPREVLTVGFVDVEPKQLQEAAERIAAAESVRHDRIAEVIESTELKAMYELVAEHDFTATPRAIEPGGAESLLAALGSAGATEPPSPGSHTPPPA